MPNVLKSLLQSPGIGTALGLVGITLAVVFYLRGRTTRRLAYQERSVRLIGGSRAALPNEVTVTYRGDAVPRLTQTTIVLWNAGNTSVSGSDIVGADPLRISLILDATIVEARVAQNTRIVNGVTVSLVPGQKNEALIDFDFLDSDDGAHIELLHTAESVAAVMHGTIRGFRNGCEFWGTIC